MTFTPCSPRFTPCTPKCDPPCIWCEADDVAKAPAEQPAPTPEDPAKPAVWDLTIEDMRARDRVGRARYGTPLQPFNGRDALRDAYEEALDQAVYLRQALFERDGR